MLYYPCFTRVMARLQLVRNKITLYKHFQIVIVLNANALIPSSSNTKRKLCKCSFWTIKVTWKSVGKLKRLEQTSPGARSLLQIFVDSLRISPNAISFLLSFGQVLFLFEPIAFLLFMKFSSECDLFVRHLLFVLLFEVRVLVSSWIQLFPGPLPVGVQGVRCMGGTSRGGEISNTGAIHSA